MGAAFDVMNVSMCDTQKHLFTMTIDGINDCHSSQTNSDSRYPGLSE